MQNDINYCQLNSVYYTESHSQDVSKDYAHRVRGKTMSGGEVGTELGSPVNPHKLYIILEFTHYQKHVMFSMDGADFKNKRLHEGVRVLVAVRA